MIGDLYMFTAIPSSENPSRRDSDLEDLDDTKRAKTLRHLLVRDVERNEE